MEISPLRAHWTAAKAVLCALCLLLSSYNTQASTPDNIFRFIERSNRMLGEMLEKEGIKSPLKAVSREKDIKPMHLYELHIAILNELYVYSVNHGKTPPPLVVASPIAYSSAEVYDLSSIVHKMLMKLYTDNVSLLAPRMAAVRGKTVNDVFEELFDLYHKMSLLNGREVGDNEVFAQAQRVKLDLKLTLEIISDRLKNDQENEKRLLLSAIYGLNPDGSTMGLMENGKKPQDLVTMSLNIRKQLNQLRKLYKLEETPAPTLSEFGNDIQSMDAFLQTQFIISELNLIKKPLKIQTSSNQPRLAQAKTTSHVFHELKHVNYMLDRLLSVVQRT